MTTAPTTPAPHAPDEDPVRIVVLLGSIREGRAGAPITHWLLEQAQGRTDVTIDLVDLADPLLPVVLPEDDTDLPAPVAAVGTRLDAADAFVVVTPEYNHSFPASLKNTIDWFYDEWAIKPVAFVSYGGRAQGSRAVEQLRLVFAELSAVTIRDTVGIDLSDVDHDGRPTSPGIDGAAKQLFDQLTWWATVLRTARRRDRP